MDTRLRGYDTKAACNFMATAVLRCKKQHFPIMTARLVYLSLSANPSELKPACQDFRIAELEQGNDIEPPECRA